MPSVRRRAGADTHRARPELQGRWLVRKRLRFEKQLGEQRFRFKGRKQAGRKIGQKIRNEARDEVRNEGSRRRQQQLYHGRLYPRPSRCSAKVDQELILKADNRPRSARYHCS